MNYKKLHLVLMALVAVFIISCETIPEDKAIEVSDVSISGQASDYIKVVDGEYILKPVDGKIIIAVKFELTKKFDLSGDPELGNLTLLPLDETGAVIPNIGLDFKLSSSSDYDKINSFLKGEVGKSVIVSFEWSYFSNLEIQNRIIDGTKNIEIVRADFTGDSSESDEYYEVEKEVSSIVSSIGSLDIEKMLDDYEEYVNQYIVFMEKAQKGDMDAMANYPTMMEKAEEFGQSLQDAQEADEISPAQIKRMLKIQAKMTNAAAEMY